MKRLSAGGKSVRPQNGFRAKDKIMKRCKITILQRTLNEKLAREYAAPGFTKCPMMREGQVFYADYAKPEGFCAILETMWVWNDYLLPTLVLDIKKYRTIPMAIQYFRGGYGRVELAPMMACIIIAIIPIIILYMTCQKYIIEGVVAGAVKG